LFRDNVSEIVTLSGWQYGLRALSNLSRFLGCYDVWMLKLKRSGIRWSNGDNAMRCFHVLWNGEEERSKIEEWMMEAKRKLDEESWTVIRFLALTGLRTETEGLLSLKIISEKGLEGYLAEKGGVAVLEHFRFKEFLRMSKKAFISVLTERLKDDLEEKRVRFMKYGKLRKRIRTKGLKCRLYDLRKWNATVLRMGGLEAEYVDLLHGRVGATVFVQSYLREDMGCVLRRARQILEKEEERLLL